MSVSVTRRTALVAAAATGAATLVPTPAKAARSAFAELEAKIKEGMAKYAIPGVALGLRHRGRDYLRGYGVTSVADPHPVDPDTVFQVASTTKTFTGTALMRLVERGRLDLNRTVRSYLPDFRTADPAASARVTVRQVIQHSPGWLGDFLLDTGTDDGALARYVAAMSRVPQLTAPGSTFGYNNAALSVAGRLIEVASGRPYEKAIRDLVTGPLGLRTSGFSPADLPGARIALPHAPGEDGNPVPYPELFAVPRSLAPAGGLLSSARDQLRWARFHLGDGKPLLNRHSMHLMQSHPGPGGTLFVELNGVGISWMLRPTAEGPLVVQHGGDWSGQHSGFLMVPERDFAITVLTNSETGPALLAELFADDWALSRFAGVHNLPAKPRLLPADRLAEYAGTYSFEQIGFDGETASVSFDLVPDAGTLLFRAADGSTGGRLVFYRRDYVLEQAPDGEYGTGRDDFVRGADGSVAWFRSGGRLFRRTPPGTAPLAAPRRATPSKLPTLSTGKALASIDVS
ncbi:CubicO group peptidase (beta-lactamase class C family) [Actinoplanes octamycinicus]|uniref:CubicO group peptidase (Beta-lactamase class C family) n=1 Tax=Actinoplanes octamycinicus TaxID=135948 RepID=A0A7W7M7T1_9ACTN|nr:serine hydrolase domain-containing protein [Actinoplanes octamycinicus]MBB4740222.1 CubicO group peptidase (beta-lactamase class C family) [Actinoplanes octamycinicus]GIE59618.1 penicillin-binding protein [Actinoplanes octamycinicus]